MAKIAYLRVSTKHQAKNGGGLIRQEYAMPEDIEKTFTDEASGKDTERPGLKKLMDYVREGDTVYFESFSRISRSLPDLLNILDAFGKKGVAFISLKENVSTEGATGKLIVSVLGAINAYEREINEERREFGYRRALAEERVGRPKIIPDETFYSAVKEWREGKITAVEAFKKANMTKATFYNIVKRENL
jgi:DNA invertase Pin-like site-specific DNA recombinase